jgi:hypothetical protein
VISEIDAALQSLVRAEVLGGTNDVSISFEAPDSEWAAQQSSLAISIYLYDVSESLARREMAYEAIRDESGRVVDRRPPPRRFDLSYLVSAWTQRVEDEHRLLDDVLVCLLSHEVMPAEHLGDEVAAQPLPVRLVAGRPRPEGRRATDVWNALGGSLKPTVDLVVTTCFSTRRASPAGPPVLETPRFEFAGAAGRDATTREEERRSGRGGGPAGGTGTGIDAAGREPVAEEVVHAGRRPAGDADGDADEPGGRRFVVRGLPRR